MRGEITGPYKDLALRLRAYLERRNLTVNSASERFPTSRESLTKMNRGLQVSRGVIEEWAEAIGEDTNEWRQLAGYPPVHNTIHKVWARLEEVRQETGGEFNPTFSEMLILREKPDTIDDYVESVRRRQQERQAAAG